MVVKQQRNNFMAGVALGTVLKDCSLRSCLLQEEFSQEHSPGRSSFDKEVHVLLGWRDWDHSTVGSFVAS